MDVTDHTTSDDRSFLRAGACATSMNFVLIGLAKLALENSGGLSCSTDEKDCVTLSQRLWVLGCSSLPLNKNDLYCASSFK